jgi:SMC interacting uncharacterized protein involved in chromosome segregation
MIQYKTYEQLDEATQSKVRHAVAFRIQADKALDKVPYVVEDDMSYMDEHSAEYARYECLKAQFEQILKDLPEDAHRLANCGVLVDGVVKLTGRY